MNLFEMTFHVEHVDDGLVDMLIDDYEATTGTDHTGHEFVTVLVQNWTSGRRRDDFPLAVNPVGGGVWSWHDVWAWALSHGQLVDDGLRYPTQVETDIINAWIESDMMISWTCRPDVRPDVAISSTIAVSVLTHDQSRLGGYSNVSYRLRTKAIA